MSTDEIGPARGVPQVSSRHIRVDERFAGLLAEDFGIAKGVILDALVAEPQKQAIAICSWANRTEDPKSALLCWARKHQKGRCRRARRAPGRADRRHREISGSPGENTYGPDRGSGPTRPDDSLRGVLSDPGVLDRIAKRLGVGK